MLSFDMLPLLIRFRDIRDPTSFEELDPNDLASKYGPGYSLKSATLKPSTDEITDQLDRILVWLPALKNKALDGGTTERMNPLMIGSNDLKKEE